MKSLSASHHALELARDAGRSCVHSVEPFRHDRSPLRLAPPAPHTMRRLVEVDHDRALCENSTFWSICAQEVLDAQKSAKQQENCNIWAIMMQVAV